MTIQLKKLKARLLANPKVKAEYDALGHRRSFATADLSDERVQEIGASRMDEQHVHLDGGLEPK
jgi:hypothetical protein